MSDRNQSVGAIHPSAMIEHGVLLEGGAAVAARAEIGRGTRISAGATIGEAVAIGRDCVIAAGATIEHALIGNRVIVHPGARIGPGRPGRPKGERIHPTAPAFGRVILQDDVEIGASATIERGSDRDTVIGEATRIGSHAAIAEDVRIGRHCVVGADTAMSSSASLGDFVTIGGKSSVGKGVRIGAGARIAAGSLVREDIPAGADFGGAGEGMVSQDARSR